MVYLLYTIFVIACFVLIVSVLLQPGKADAGALFTSSVSSTAFGPRGTQTLLAKITIGATIIFFVLSLVLSLPLFSGTRSVLESQPVGTTAPASQPTATATPDVNPSPAASVAPTESSTTNGAAQNSPSPNAPASPQP